MSPDIEHVMQLIRTFRDERDWMQFHDPKSMAASIAIEASELLEHFQWRNGKDAEEYAKNNKEEIGEEMADVAVYLFEMADNLDIDLLAAMEEKLKKNALKYPIEKAKGSNIKYNKL